MTTFAAWPQNYLTQSGTMAQDWSGTLTVSSGTAAVVTDDVDTASGATRSLKATYNGSAASQSRMPLSATVTAAQGPFSVTLRVKAPATNAAPSPIEIRLYDSGLTKYLNFYHSIANDGEWHTIACTYDQLLTGGSFTKLTDAAVHVQVREDRSGARGLPNMASGEYFLVGPVILNRMARPKLMFTIDDGRKIETVYAGHPTNEPVSGGTYREIFTYYGKPATCYIIPSVVGTSGYETQALLLDAQTAGWSIATHSIPNETGNIGNSLHGLRTLGTFGYGPFTISGADTTANTFTITAHPFASGAAVIFDAAVAPGGITLGTTYYLRNLTTDTVSVHPTYTDATANTNAVDITSAGTTVTCRWASAQTNGDLIRSTVEDDMEAVRALGFTGWRHYALPQGGSDREVIDAITGLGLRSVRGVGTGYPVPYAIGKIGIVPDLYVDEFQLLGHAFDLETLGSAATITAIQNGLRNGASMSVYCHTITETIAVSLDAVLAEAVRLERQGLLDIVNVEQWYAGLTRPQAVT